MIHRFELVGGANMNAFCVSPADGAIATLAFMFYPGARDPERDGSLEAAREEEVAPAAGSTVAAG